MGDARLMGEGAGQVHLFAAGDDGREIAAALAAAGYRVAASGDGGDPQPGDGAIVIACASDAETARDVVRRLRSESSRAFILLACFVDLDVEQLRELRAMGADDVATMDPDEIVRRVALAPPPSAAEEIAPASHVASWRTLVEASRDIMMVLDREGSILYINHTIPGFEISQVLNTSAFNYMPLDARESFEEYLRSAYEDVAETTYQMVASGPQGARAVYESHMVPVVVAEKVVAAVLTTRDVTGQQEQDRQRQAVEEIGSSLQKAQSLRLLASGVAHDFNNLIGVVMGNASRALRRSENEAVRESLDVILRASQSAGDLTKQLLAYSGEQHSESTVTDLSLQVESMKKLMRAAVPASIDMTFELSEDVPVVDIDVSKLQHAVLNLVINGRDAIGEGPGALTIRTREHDFREGSDSGIMMCDPELRGKCAVLEVEDDGCGFDEEIRTKIFDPFFTTKESGKGLGLAVVVGVMRAHGGAVAVTSRRGEGTAFRIFFPESGDGAGQSAGKPSRLGAS